MFPNVEPSVITMILENVNHDLEKASDLLLEMSGECQREASSSVQGIQPLNIDEFPSVEAAWGASHKPLFTKPKPSHRVMSKPAPTSQSHSLTTIGSKMSSEPELSSCLEELELGHKVLVVMRGLPGSGKSTLSNRLVSLAGCGEVLSTDQYFYDSRGQFRFRPELLSEAHSYNQKRASEAVKERKKLIIIDNTNTFAWEMRPYIELGVNNYYTVKIIEPSTEWRLKPSILAKKNSHGVPREKIQVMLDRFEFNLTVDSLMSLWRLTPPSPPSPPTPSSSLPPVSPVPVIPQAVPDLEEASSSAVSDVDETFISDSEDDHETEEDCNVVFPDHELNPEVEEFRPDLQTTTESPPTDGQTEELGELLSLFPHLTAEEVTEMYNNQTIKMSLHPTFAVTLQEHFGEVAPQEYLGKLGQDQMLSLDISLNHAKVLFTLWQQSVLAKLNDDSLLVSDTLPGPSQMTRISPVTNTAPAKTVLAPNAVAYYEEQMLGRAVEESKVQARGAARVKPRIVIKENNTTDKESNEEVNESNLDELIERRNNLYKKAMEVSGPHMQVIITRVRVRVRSVVLEMCFRVSRATTHHKLES